MSVATEEARLVINEVMYDPDDGGDEWLELYNAGSEVGLDGVTLTDQDGHDYAFPDLLFPAAAYLILMVGAGLDEGFGDGPAVLHMGFSTSVFNNAGDDVLLEGYGGVVDFMSYGDGSAVDPPPPLTPWEGSAERAPAGFSLSLQPDGMDEAGPEDWTPSIPTPGGPNGNPTEDDLLISEVYYHAFRDNEYVALYNAGSSAANLTHWQIRDGEGAWELEGVSPLRPGQRLVVSQNATALREDAGIPSDLCVKGCGTRLTVRGRFALANGGDEVGLFDPYGRSADSFHYGTSDEREGWIGEGASLLKRGYVAKRKAPGGTFQDTDSAVDWDWRRTFRLGQSAHEVHSVRDVLVKPFTSPESSLDHMLRVINASVREVLLSGFKLTNWQMASALAAALERGVEVRIGLEGTPPGGVDPVQDAILSDLASKGASVSVMRSSGDGFRRYSVHHAKYVVVDGTWLVQGSENFSDTGYPLRAEGNRGWGVVIHSPDLARLFSELFSEDWNTSRADVGIAAGPRLADGSHGGSTQEPPLPWDELIRADVQMLLSPDNAVSEGGLMGALREARQTVEVELFYLRQDWHGYPNPLIERLTEAARRGVRVRLLLDGSSYNLEGGDDNDEAASTLNYIAAREGIPLEVRLFEPDATGLVKLHNKGLVIDGETVFTSSINWNYHGAYENRESGLLLRSQDLASFFTRVFDEDWDRELEPVNLAIHGPGVVTVGEEAAYEARLSARAPSMRFTWDLHGDGDWDASGPAFSFVPTKEGTYLLRVRAEGESGQSLEAEALITVTSANAWHLRPGPEMLVGIVTGVAALLLLRKLRTKGEPTNKDLSKGKKSEERDPDIGGGN